MLNKHINCYKIRDALIDYVCGELDQDYEALVREHISICPDCQNELELLQSIGDAVSSEEMPVLTQSFWQGFIVEVHQRIEVNKKRTFPFWIMPAAAGLILIIGLGYLLTKGEKRELGQSPLIDRDSVIVRDIQTFSQSEIESIIKSIGEKQELNQYLWDLGNIESDHFKRLVKEEILLEKDLIQK